MKNVAHGPKPDHEQAKAGLHVQGSIFAQHVYHSGGPGIRRGNPGYASKGDSTMKLWIAALVVLGAPVCALAQIKSCDDLKTKIAKKIDAHGGSNYTLSILDKGKETDGKIVGTCGGGTKSIVYIKAATDTAAPAPKPAATPKPSSESTPK
jgi:hypothetical protein